MIYAIVAVIAVIADQLVKYLVESRVVLDAIGDDIIHLIPGFVHITNVHNYGAAFSFLTGARWFFVVLCIVFVLVVVYVLAKNIINTPGARWMAVIVTAGAVGNCIDRIVCGYVVDMFEFEFIRFPVFNVADIFITLGAIVFCIFVLLEKPPVEETNIPIPAPEPEEPPHERKPLIRKHQKVEIPTFPKHEPRPEAPAVDPDDPFAEWERRANPPKAAPATENTVVYTQPIVREAPAASAAPAAPAAEKEPAADADSNGEPCFNLDDILSEFKDS